MYSNLKISIFLLFSFLSANANQNYKHYIITKEGKKIQCSLENFNFKKGVGEFITFKRGEKKLKETIASDRIKEIGIRKRKYIIANVEIDNSSDNFQDLGKEKRTKEFFFKNRTLFLEILVEGKTILYRSYLDGIEKYFFKSNKLKTPKQLLYKRYFLKRDPLYIGSDYMDENKAYYRQLIEHAPCIGKKGIKFPEYKKLSLIKYFETYNEANCN